MLTLNLQISSHPFERSNVTDGRYTRICPTMRGLEGVKVQQESGGVAIGNHVIHHNGNIRPIHLIVVRVQPLDGGRKVRGHCTGEGVLSSGRERVGRSSNVHSVSQFWKLIRVKVGLGGTAGHMAKFGWPYSNFDWPRKIIA